MPNRSPDLWVFAYGSLMWRPDFPFAECVPARLDGWHRRFCIVSRLYRGTDRLPGLVLGLDRGGACDGRVFRVTPEDAPAVLAYLRAREQISGVYRETQVPVALQDGSHGRCGAVTFIAERAHPSFVPPLSLAVQAAIIRGATGSSGSNLDYLVATLEVLRALSIREEELERLLVMIGPIQARNGGRRARPGGYPIAVWPRRPVLKLADVKRFVHRRRLGAHVT